MAVAGLPSALCESSITEITITLDMRVKKVFPGDLRLAADELSVDDPDGSDKESDGSDEDRKTPCVVPRWLQILQSRESTHYEGGGISF